MIIKERTNSKYFWKKDIYRIDSGLKVKSNSLKGDWWNVQGQTQKNQSYRYDISFVLSIDSTTFATNVVIHFAKCR